MQWTTFASPMRSVTQVQCTSIADTLAFLRNVFFFSFLFTVINYQVLIFTQKKMSGGGTSANCWLSVAGNLGETKKIPIPKHTMEVNVQVSLLFCFLNPPS
jgi:hypothetical protein